MPWLWRIGFLFGFLGVLGRAAEAPDRDLTERSLDELLDTRVQTVTAAAKRTQDVHDAPSAVTVVSNDEIRKQGYQTLGDILASVRGFYTTYDRNYTYLGVRGFGRPGDYNSRVLVLVNGERMNDNVTGGALIGYEFLIDPELIERVEVIRGPGSALYGSNAFFGVVNVVTRRGQDVKGAEISAVGGSLDTYQGRFSYGGAWRNGVDLLLSGTIFEREGPDRLYYEHFDQPPLSDGITRGTDGEDRRALFGRVGWRGLSLEGGWVDRQKEVPTGSFDTIFGDPRNRTTDGNQRVRLRLEHEFENEVNLDVTVSHSRYYFDGNYAYAETNDFGLPSNYLFIDQIRGEWLTEEIQLRRTWWDRLTTTAGFEARQNLRQDQENYRDDSPQLILDAPRTSATWGPYLDASLAVLTNLTLSAGVRYDQGDFLGSAVSPRASLIYRPFASSTWKLLYGRAFRGPNSYERFYTDGLTQKTNPGLGPETIDTYEVVLEQRLGEHWEVSLSGYLYYVDDLIDQVSEDHWLIYRNVDQVRGRGLEAETSVHLGHGFRGRLSGALQETEDQSTGRGLSNSPERIIQTGLVAPLYRDRIFSALDFRYVSGRTSAAGNAAPGYAVVNLTLFTRAWVRGLEVSASVYNLLDRQILDPSPLELKQPTVEQNGRTFLIRVAYHF